MYSQLKDLIKKNDEAGVRVLIEKSGFTELTQLMLPRIGHDNAPKVLNMILTNVSSSETGLALRRKLIEAVLKQIGKSDITESQVNAVVNRLIEDFSKFSKVQLVKLVDYCLNSIRSNDDTFFCWKEILPILLQILEEEKFINYKGTEVTGVEYKSLIIKSICNHPWEVGIVTPLTQMFADIILNPTDHGMVIRAICDKVPEVNHNELPPLIHQLLKLSNNQDCRLVINTLQKYFSNLYNQIPEDSPTAYDIDSIGQISLKEVQDTESTVLYHIRQAVLLNHSSLKEYMRHLKGITNAPEFILNSFPMSVLLLVADICQDQVFDIIKQALARKIQDDEKRKCAKWLKEIVPASCQAVDIINQVINNSSKDRLLILRGLVDLAFVLLETKSKDADDNLLHEIGLKTIQKLVKKRHEIGATILQKITNKIIASGTAVSQYTDCLSYMCRKTTLIVLDSQVWVCTLLEQLLAIPGEAASQVLLATLPLIRVSANIRDTLVMVLRKALYRKGAQTRQMAVTGFLQFLMDLKITPFNLSQSSSSATASSSSLGSIYTQATIERNSRPNPRQNAAFCHEILSILTRCFSHEAEVRQHLYQGLSDAVLCNPELAELIIDMLLTRLNIYYESDEDVKPPLKFNECCNVSGPEAVLQEPLAHLVFALQKIYCQVADKDMTCIDQLSMVLESLSKRMAQIELEHVNLDDPTDLMDNLPKSQQKIFSLKLIISILEALISFKINSWSPGNKNSPQITNSLFKAYNEFVEFSKKISKPKKADQKSKRDKNDTTFKKPRGRPASLKLFPTLMNIQTLRKMICLLYEPNVSWSTEEQSVILKKRIEFHNYTLRTCIQIFHTTKNMWNYERKKHCEAHIKDYIKIGQVLYQRITTDFDNLRVLDHDIAVLCLECFKELCDLMCGVFSSELPVFLMKICDTELCKDNSGIQLCKLIFSLQNHIEAYYTEEIEENDGTKKIPLILFEIISILVQKVIPTDAKTDKLFEWLKKMAKSDKLDASVATIALQLITTIEDRDDEYGRVLDEMSLELCKKFGTIDNSEPSIIESYKILNDSTLLQAHTVFNNSLKHKINNAAWAIGRLKAEQTLISTVAIANELHREQIKDKERSLCKQLSYTIQTLEYLANAVINPGPNTELTFKNLQQLYNVLNTLTKYFSNKSTPQYAAFNAVKFIQVIQLAGKSLKTTFYNLITFTEEHQSSGRKTDVQAMRNKVLKETKFIPRVVYEVEQFNKEILALSKKTGIPLESHVKHSITRDFRIKQPELVEGLERLDITQMMTQTTTQREQNTQRHLPLDDSHEETTEPDSDITQDPPPRKRQRTNSSASSSSSASRK